MSAVVGELHREVVVLLLDQGDDLLEVVAESDSGATLRESIGLPRNRTRYAIIEHWTEDDSAETGDAPVALTWELLRRAPAFG